MASRWFAPAKLNLYLHVIGRRDDGYHLLDSLVAFASVGDSVTVEPAARLSLEIDGPFAGTIGGAPNENLVWRAAEMLAEESGHAPHVKIALTKNLPAASGIGGGSSDAAACLRALAERWRTENEMVRGVAGALGSDVPACLAVSPAWLGGVGERIEPAARLPACGVVLVNPGVALPTVSVYRAFRGPFSKQARFTVPSGTAEFAQALESRRNDLTDAAIGLVPAIGDLLARLGKLDGALLARMSGSGATCFALFATKHEAEAAATLIRGEKPDWWVASAELLRDAAAAISPAPSHTS